jgi:hypothetical protein
VKRGAQRAICAQLQAYNGGAGEAYEDFGPLDGLCPDIALWGAHRNRAANLNPSLAPLPLLWWEIHLESDGTDKAQALANIKLHVPFCIIQSFCQIVVSVFGSASSGRAW